MGTPALVTLVVVDTAVRDVFAVQVPVVQVVDVVAVHDGVVAAAWSVRVAVQFRRSVLDSRHATHAHVRRRR
ncbi:hypothetical protein Lesp01_07480 [Lentzea sp. NBRC 102530]|nr:hypothetical protein Lesp01_07480 [Lentzea sp. NBRC 102530]